MKKEIIKKLLPITEEEQRFLDGNNEINRELYMSGNAPVINSKKLLREGKMITIRSHTRFVHFPKHTHDYVEVIYMCQGSTTHLINGEKIELSQGELLFLTQSAEQEILPAKKDDIAVNFIILPQFFDSSLNMLKEESSIRSFVIDCLRNSNSGTPYLYFKVSDVLPVQNLLENLVWTLINDTANKRQINEITMGLLLLQLLNYTDKMEYKSNKLIDKVLNYIEDNYATGSLQEMSRLFNYDIAWLSREIRKLTGKTYTELVQEKRLNQAAFLLSNTNLSVDEIIHRTGYDNKSYFHRIFREKYNTTPKKFRGKNP